MATWTSLTYSFGSVLTSTKMTQNQDNFLAIAEGASGAPKIQAAAFDGSIGLYSTGDVKLTFKTTADTGWVMMNDGSIGNASSGATTRANADTEALFTLLWNNVSNTWAPVSTGRGASAAADFAANKTLTLPRTLGRALAVSGAGASLTSRGLGEYLGAETHTLTDAEINPHVHTQRTGINGAPGLENMRYATAIGGGTSYTESNAGSGSFASATGVITTSSVGSGNAHNNMQPTAFMNVMVKL